ncbi:hypothetical protein [Hymenobacter fodinae]|uniref:Uncharacterized protein n=1 Tax=Hymenobacter fodinae TaxID=2510796 RepID=A0A4Z0P8F1_9BACT|nr:hypothetical protein [Hymenobacter fodinae]TGE08280.1 hypothetical protein EU556_11200 [Hymenobacter fodinae]
MSALQSKIEYLAALSKAAPFLTGNYKEELQNRLPGKSENRIKNARAGLVRDQEVLTVLLEIAERERVERRNKALKELELTSQSLIESAAA